MNYNCRERIWERGWTKLFCALNSGIRSFPKLLGKENCFKLLKGSSKRWMGKNCTVWIEKASQSCSKYREVWGTVRVSGNRDCALNVCLGVFEHGTLPYNPFTETIKIPSATTTHLILSEIRKRKQFSLLQFPALILQNDIRTYVSYKPQFSP